MKAPTPDFKLRLPPELRARIDDAAKRNSRSVNGEIVARLQRTIAEDAERNAEALKTIQASPTIQLEKRMVKDRADLEQRIDDLAEEVAALKDRLDKLGR